MKTTERFWGRSSIIILIIIIVISTVFPGCVKEDSEIALSMIVQPDRVNLKGEGYDITAFSNDAVTLDIYLANRGDLDAESVEGVLIIPEGTGISPINGTFYFERIGEQNVAIGQLSFSTSNVTDGIYDLELSVVYQDNEGEHFFKYPVNVKVSEIGVSQITHPTFSQFTYEANDFPAPLDSVILGYSGIFASEDQDDFQLTIKNGGHDVFENFNVEIIPPEGITSNIRSQMASTKGEEQTVIGNLVAFSVPPDVLESGGERNLSVDLVATDIEPGIYDFQVNMSYTRNGQPEEVVDTFSIGICDVILSSDIRISNHSQAGKAFAIDSEVKIVTPHQDTITVSPSDLEFIDVAVPTDTASIKASIKDIVERGFPAYLDKATFSYHRSNWWKSRISEAAKGELDLMGRAILDNFSPLAGKLVGYDLSGQITRKLLEDEGFNAAVDLESEGMASDTGIYHGEIVFKEALSDATFLSNYLGLFAKKDSVKLQMEPVDKPEDVKVPLDLTAASNILPITWTMVSDEDSTYTRSDPGLNNIIVDNLPVSLTLDLSRFREEYNLTDLPVGDYEAIILLKSPNSINYYRYDLREYVPNEDGANEINVFNIPASLTLNIDSLEKSKYKIIAMVDIKDISGVSESIAFEVTDTQPPEKQHNDVMDFLSEADLHTMNRQPYFHQEVVTITRDGALAKNERYIFEKILREDDPRYDVSLVSTKYDSRTDTTELSFELVSNETKPTEFGFTTFLIDYTGEQRTEIDKKNTTVHLTENTPSVLTMETKGRYGYDFNDIAVKLGTSSEAPEIIGIFIGIADIMGIGDYVRPWNDFRILQDNIDLKDNIKPYTIYVGEIFKPNFVIHYKANGLFDRIGSYQMKWTIDPPGETHYTPVFNAVVTQPFSTEQLFDVLSCKKVGDPLDITVTAEVYKIVKYRSHGWIEPVGRLWESVLVDTVKGTIQLTAKNPLEIVNIYTNTIDFEQGETTKVTVAVKFLQREGQADMDSTPSTSINITAANLIDPSGHSVIKRVGELPIIEWGHEKNIIFEVTHTEDKESHPTEHLLEVECLDGISGEGYNRLKPWKASAVGAKGRYRIVDTTPPTIEYKDPVHREAKVSVETYIGVAFSEPMDKASVESAFTLNPPVEGTKRWSGNMMIIYPSDDLTYSTKYTVTIDNKAQDLSGNSLKQDPWHFETEREFVRVVVNAANVVTDTGVDLVEGDEVEISVDPDQTWSAGPDEPFSRESNADGISWIEPLTYGNFAANFGALVGQIGAGEYFLIGTAYVGTVSEPGRLSLYYWDDWFPDNSGHVEVEIRINSGID